MSEMMDPSKMKVAELRSELQERGLDTKGNKPVLVERLREALETEATDGGGNDTGVDGANESMNKGPAKGDEDEEEAVDDDEEAVDDDEEVVDDNEEVVEDDEEEEEAAEPTPSPQKTPEVSPKKKPEASPKKTPEASPKKTPEASPQKSPMKAPEAHTSPRKTPQKVVDTPTAVKDEPEDKMGYEDGPMEFSNMKEEPGNGEVKEEEMEVKQEEQEPPKRGEKRRLSRSQSPPQAKRSRPEVEEVRVEEEPEMDKAEVTLDWYNADLSLVINKEDFLSAQPLTMQGFGYVWHGVRATYGFTKGRVFFEVHVDDYLPVPQLEEEEQHPHVLRVGWSINDAGLTLGEDPFSYGYGGTSKASTDLKFKDYGKKFGKGDSVGCFLDLENEPIVMTFTVNGEHQGIAYEIYHSDLGGQALFPHIVTKNASFRVNFGSHDPWAEPLTGYTFAGLIPLEDRVLGGAGPAKRDEAEVIMMVGLPAAGKTTWVEKYCKENLDKKYNVLGTNSLIDKMKVNGLPRRRNYAGRWEVLIERCTKCLNKLLELGYKRRRNFIVDQTNVYPSAQRRKMKGFAGFKRRAVVICPSDEDLKKRTEKREKEEGKDVPDKAVLEMKANFKVPEEGDLFDEVEFVELTSEEAQKVVDQYNKEGEDAGYGQKKSFRGGFSDRRGFMDRRGSFGNRGGSFRGGWDRDRRGGSNYNDRRDRTSWNRDRDSRDYSRGGGYNRDTRGSGGGSYNRDYNNRGSSYNRDSRGSGGSGGYNRERGGRSNYQSSWNRNSSNTSNNTASTAITTTKSSTTTTTNPWANQQGGATATAAAAATTSGAAQTSGGYGNYAYAGNQTWGSGGGYNYGQGGGGYGNWNQQYYGQQQPAATGQQPQQYWNAGYYGQQYGTGQQYGSSSSNTASTTGWGSQSSWGGTGGQQQQQWGSSGSTYGNRQQWGGTSNSGSTGSYSSGTASTTTQRR